MREEKILVVDDEKNIRLTLSQVLETAGFEVDTAANGEEALRMIEEKDYRVVLLDLKMPGMDGMEVLRKITETRPDIRFVIITAHGTVESAVDAMKMGAVDFLQKPFTPTEIRDMVSNIINREKLEEPQIQAYDEWIELAKRNIGERHFKAAEALLKKAVALEPRRPEVFNLLGVLAEIAGNKEEATENYRSAYWIEPSYRPSRENLERITKSRFSGSGIDMGKDEDRVKRKGKSDGRQKK